MPRATLEDMAEELRAEISASLSPGHGLNQQETHYYKLRRTERELYLAFDWPDLVIEERVPVTAGDQYAGPFTNINVEQINEVWTAYGSDWQKLEYGFTPEDYSVYDPASGERSYPITKYRHVPAEEKIELWPLPNQNTTLIIRGPKKLGTLRNPSDTSTLDGTLIVLFTAADILSAWDPNEAQTKAQKAASYLRMLRSNLSSDRTRITSLTPTSYPRPRQGLDYIPDAPS